MEYEELTPITRAVATRLLASEEPRQVVRALLRLALHDPEWRYAQDVCLSFLSHADVWVRRNAATGLGHIARLHGQLELQRVTPALEQLLADPDVKEWAESALDDLRIFLDPAHPNNR